LKGARWALWKRPERLSERQQAKLAQVKQGLTKYWGVWDIFARQELDKAILGQQSPRQALKNMANRWQQLKKQYGG